MENIIKDTTVIEKGLSPYSASHNFDGSMDALNRLVKYVHTLEVQNGYLTDFIDEQTDRLAGVSGQYDEQLEALRVALADAQTVDDNYGLLKKTEEAVEDWAERYVDMAEEPEMLDVSRLMLTDHAGGYSEATTEEDPEEVELTLYECVGCAKQYEILTIPKMIVEYDCEICDSTFVRKFWDDEDNKETVMMGETIRKRLERL